MTEAARSSLSPEIATLSDGESGEDAVDRLLCERRAAVERREAHDTADALENSVAEQRARHQRSDAILALARALSGLATERYRMRGSCGGSYLLNVVDGGEVSASAGASTTAEGAGTRGS